MLQASRPDAQFILGIVIYKNDLYMCVSSKTQDTSKAALSLLEAVMCEDIDRKQRGVGLVEQRGELAGRAINISTYLDAGKNNEMCAMGVIFNDFLLLYFSVHRRHSTNFSLRRACTGGLRQENPRPWLQAKGEAIAARISGSFKDMSIGIDTNGLSMTHAIFPGTFYDGVVTK